MLSVVIRYIFDAVYVGLFFTVMSALAYGAHLLVRLFEERCVDEAVIMILRSVEILLAASDSVETSCRWSPAGPSPVSVGLSRFSGVLS